MLANGGKLMKDKRLDARIKLILTEEEKQRIKDKAAAAGMNVSKYLRACITRKKIVYAPELPELCRQIIRVGVNTSQILTVYKEQAGADPEQVKTIETNWTKIQNLTGDLIKEVHGRKDRTRYKI